MCIIGYIINKRKITIFSFNFKFNLFKLWRKVNFCRQRHCFEVSKVFSYYFLNYFFFILKVGTKFGRKVDKIKVRRLNKIRFRSEKLETSSSFQEIRWEC